MKKKRQSEQNISANLAALLKLGSFTEIIATLENRRDLNREEIQALAKSFKSLGRTKESLFVLLPLRGKVSNELDIEIKSGLDTLCEHIEASPEFLETLTVPQTRKLASGLRTNPNRVSHFKEIVRRLVELTLKQMCPEEWEDTFSFLSAIQADLGATGLEYLAKLRSQAWYLEKKGEPELVAGQIISAGVQHFLNNNTPNEAGFLSFASAVGALFFPPSSAANAAQCELINSEAKIIVRMINIILSRKIVFPETFLSPGFFYSLPNSSNKKHEFSAFLASIPDEFFSVNTMYNPDCYLGHCLSLGLWKEKRTVFLSRWYKKLENLKPPEHNFVLIKYLAQAALQQWNDDGRSHGNRHPDVREHCLYFCKHLEKLSSQEFFALAESSLLKPELSHTELFFWLETILPGMWTVKMATAIAARLISFSDSDLISHLVQKEWLLILFNTNLLSHVHQQDVAERLHEIELSSVIFSGLRSNMLEKSHQKLFSGKADPKEVKNFFRAFIDNFLIRSEFFATLSPSEASALALNTIGFLRSIGKKRNLLLQNPYLKILKTEIKCPCWGCLLDFLADCKIAWTYAGIMGRTTFSPTADQSAVGIQQSSTASQESSQSNIVNPEELLLWKHTPYETLGLRPGSTKAEVLKKSMELMASRKIEMKTIRNAQALLLNSHAAAFLSFFWDFSGTNARNVSAP